MPHYSNINNPLTQSSSSVGEVTVKKVNAGTYVKLYKDKDGVLKGERFVLHDEQAVENAQLIDTRISNAEKGIANYEAHQNKMESMGRKLDDAIAEHEDSERKALEAEENLDKKEAELDKAEKDLEAARGNTENLRAQLASYPNPAAAPPDLYEELQKAEETEQECENNVSDKENEVTAAQGEYNEALDQQEATFNKMDAMNKAYKTMETNAPPKPNFTKEDVKLAKSQSANSRTAAARANFGQAATSNNTIRSDIKVRGFASERTSTVRSNELFDLRSIGR